MVVRAEVVNVGICSSVDGVVVLSLSVSAGLPPGSSTPPVGSVDGGLVDTVSPPSVSTGRSVVVVDRAVVVIGTTTRRSWRRALPLLVWWPRAGWSW